MEENMLCSLAAGALFISFGQGAINLSHAQSVRIETYYQTGHITAKFFLVAYDLTGGRHSISLPDRHSIKPVSQIIRECDRLARK